MRTFISRVIMLLFIIVMVILSRTIGRFFTKKEEKEPNSNQTKEETKVMSESKSEKTYEVISLEEFKELHIQKGGYKNLIDFHMNASVDWHKNKDRESLDTLLDMCLHCDRAGGEQWTRSEILKIMGKPVFDGVDQLNYLDVTEGLCYQVFFEEHENPEKVTGWTHD